MDTRYGSLAHNGFTLIELILVIVITGIIAGMISVFISKPMEGYVAVSNRAELVDAAASALQMMARDIRQAVPNSIRCNTTGCVNATALELLHTIDGVRYRKGGYASGPDTRRQLDVTASDPDFNTIGQFQNSPPLPLPFSSTADRLVIYNLGTPGYDAYQITGASSSGVMTPPGTTITITDDGSSHKGEDHVNLSPAWKFGTDSPRQRLFLVDTPVSYQCDIANDVLLHYSNYAINPNPPFSGGAVIPGTPLTEYVTACQINYAAGTATRGGLVTISLTLTKGGESITLLHQVHVDNAP